MPLIPPYGLRVPEKSDQPDVAGDMLNLGEDVRDQLVRVDNDIAEIQTELGRGWVPIDSGEEDGNFTIDLTAGGKFPAGTFSLIRIYFRGSTSADGVRVQARVNEDTTPELHLRAWQVVNTNSGAIVDSLEGNNPDVTSWPFAYWSSAASCNAQMLIYRTDVPSILSMEATSYRAASGANARHIGTFRGHLAEPRLLHSLRIFPFTGVINDCLWWAEGFRV